VKGLRTFRETYYLTIVFFPCVTKKMILTSALTSVDIDRVQQNNIITDYWSISNL